MAQRQKNRVQQHMEADSQSQLAHYADSAREVLEEYPIGITLAVFAAGLGIGALVGSSLAEPLHIRRRPAVAENIGRRILAAIEEALPDSVSRHLHS